KWSASIYNSEEQHYTTVNTNNSELVTGNSSVEVGLPAGTYYIRVENYSSAVDKVYDMTVKYTESDLYEKEFNNTVATATPFKLNNSYKGTISHSSDLDFYKFTLASDSNVSISISALEGKSWSLYLQDDKGNTVDYFYTKYSGVISNSASIDVGLPKGTYYVKVSNYTNSVDHPYTLKINAKASKVYEKEHNDTFTTATTLPLNTAMNGSIGNKPSSDYDYYKLVVPTSGNVKVSMTQKSGYAWNINLMDSKGTSVMYANTNYNDLVKGNWTSSLYLTKGTYYIRISNYTNATWKPYTLKVSQTTVTPTAKNITIKNNKGKADTITVKSVKKGSTIKVYNSKSKQIASVKATGTTATLTVKQLGTQAGKVYVTVQEPGKLVSARRTVNFAKEK
ncbi:MAG: PPC domain-containing protein, partial [Lysinibacillus sp.]